LIKSPSCSQIVSFGRRALDIKHPKLRHFIGNLDYIERELDRFALPISPKFEIAICTLGSRHPHAPALNEVSMHKVDVEYPVRFAQWSHAHGVRYFGLLSYVHAMPQSSRSLQKLKGRAELGVKQCRFEHLSLFRPAWIRRKEPLRADEPNLIAYWLRRVQWMAMNEWRFVMPLMYVPARLLARKNLTVDAEVLGRAMVLDAERFIAGQYDDTKRVGARGISRLYYDDFIKL
jgi:hypothetical protein